MLSNISIAVGDEVVCVNDELPSAVSRKHIHVIGRIKRGRVYRVAKIIWLNGEKGVHLAGVDHHPTDGWRACRFRKVDRTTAGALAAGLELELQ